MNIDKELLHIVAARYISNKDSNLEIKGSKIQLECLYELLETSKKLKESLDKKSNIEEIVALLETKKQLTKKFQNVTGIKWHL